MSYIHMCPDSETEGIYHQLLVKQIRALYVAGMQAGDSTLNAICSLRVAQTLAGGNFSNMSNPEARAAVLNDYVQFMTTPGTHEDTYAESFHRSFFSDWQDSRPTSPSKVHTHTHPTSTVIYYSLKYKKTLK